MIKQVSYADLLNMPEKQVLEELKIFNERMQKSKSLDGLWSHYKLDTKSKRIFLHGLLFGKLMLLNDAAANVSKLIAQTGGELKEQSQVDYTG